MTGMRHAQGHFQHLPGSRAANYSRGIRGGENRAPCSACPKAGAMERLVEANRSPVPAWLCQLATGHDPQTCCQGTACLVKSVLRLACAVSALLTVGHYSFLFMSGYASMYVGG